MTSNVTWSENETGQCNTSRCVDGDGVDDQRIIRTSSLPIYLAAFIFGLTGNTLVIYVIARFVPPLLFSTIFYPQHLQFSPSGTFIAMAERGGKL